MMHIWSSAQTVTQGSVSLFQWSPNIYICYILLSAFKAVEWIVWHILNVIRALTRSGNGVGWGPFLYKCMYRNVHVHD